MNKDLYIIHGWTYRPEPWEEVITVLAKKHHLRAELLRVPGLGTPSDRVFTIEDYVTWARQRLPRGAIALGHSNGGRILLNLLTTDGSDYLKGLILLDSAGIYEETTKQILIKKLNRAVAPLKRLPAVRRVARRVFGSSDYTHAPENMRQTLKNMLASDHPLTERLQDDPITTPTQIIWGSDDQMTPVRQAYYLHGVMPYSKLTVKNGWRHSHYLTSIDELSAEIAKQYRELQRRAKI